MQKLDFKKEYGDWYTASTNQVKWVTMPSVNYLMMDGKGDPNTTPEYARALEALYALAYTIKFRVKRVTEMDFGVLPLEGLWWVPNMELFSVENKNDWLWTMMILQPPLVTAKLVTECLDEARRKKDLPNLDQLRFEGYDEGQAAQVMHIGPYSTEAPTIQKLHDFIQAQDCQRRGKHHEIYLGDPRRSDPAKLRTILRQPVDCKG